MFAKRIFCLLANMIPVTFFACSNGTATGIPSSVRGHTMGDGYGGWIMWLIVPVLIGVFIYFLLQVLKSKGSDNSLTETPSDTLKMRYAKGEIDKAEFDQIQNDLE